MTFGSFRVLEDIVWIQLAAQYGSQSVKQTRRHLTCDVDTEISYCEVVGAL